MEAKKYLTADFLDILFEEKNKLYGAYELRRKYEKRLARAMGVTLGFVMLLTGTYAVANYMKKGHRNEMPPPEKKVVLENVDIKTPDQPPPPPPPPAPEQKMKPQQQFTQLKVVKDNEVKPQEQPPDLDQLDNKIISTQTLAGAPNGIDVALVDKGTGVVAAAPESKKIFVAVEQMPEFPGGEEALMKFLRSHIHYPNIARESQIQGIVVVKFVVNTDGTIQDVSIASARKGGGLEEEATRVVKEMPKWKPGRQNGRDVRVWFNLPVRFMLQ